MENYQALEALVSATNKKIGYIPSTPSEFNQLSLMINQETERTLSLSSIKRIWGYVPYDGFPSVTTLNTLAFFNGYRDWNTFLISLSTEEIEDSGFMLDSIVNTESLKPGDRLLIKWGVGKSCEIECLGQMNFKVVSSHNIKLAVGDRLKLHTVCRASSLRLRHPAWRPPSPRLHRRQKRRHPIHQLPPHPLSKVTP